MFQLLYRRILVIKMEVFIILDTVSVIYYKKKNVELMLKYF